MTRKRIRVESFNIDECAALLGAVSLQIERCGRAQSADQAKVIASLFTVRAKILAALGTTEEAIQHIDTEPKR